MSSFHQESYSPKVVKPWYSISQPCLQITLKAEENICHLLRKLKINCVNSVAVFFRVSNPLWCKELMFVGQQTGNSSVCHMTNQNMNESARIYCGYATQQQQVQDEQILWITIHNQASGSDIDFFFLRCRKNIYFYTIALIVRFILEYALIIA